MYRSHLLALGLLAHAARGGECLDQPDTNTGGGPGGTPAQPSDAAAPGGAAAPADGADPGAGEHARTDAGADGDLDEDDDDPADGEVADLLPEANVRTRLRGHQRKLSKLRPYDERLRDPRTGKRMPVDQLDRVLRDAKEFGTIDRVLQLSPRAVQVLMEEQARLEGRGPASAEEEFPAFNETDWPYETDTPQGKRLLEMARSNHEHERKLRTLERRLEQSDRNSEVNTTQQLEGRWKAELTAAVKELPRAEQELVATVVRERFRSLTAQKKLRGADAKQHIEELIGPFLKARRLTTRQTTVRQSEMVAGNDKLPKHPRPGAVQPATGKTPGSERETMRDASKGFLAKYRH